MLKWTMVITAACLALLAAGCGKKTEEERLAAYYRGSCICK